MPYSLSLLSAAETTDSLLARLRTSFRMRQGLQGLLMPTTPVTSSNLRPVELRLSLISSALSSWMQRTILSHSFVSSLTWLPFVSHRLHRMLSFSRDSAMKSISSITDFLIAPFLLLPFTAELPSLHAATMVAVVDAECNGGVIWQNI